MRGSRDLIPVDVVDDLEEWKMCVYGVADATAEDSEAMEEAYRKGYIAGKTDTEKETFSPSNTEDAPQCTSASPGSY